MPSFGSSRRRSSAPFRAPRSRAFRLALLVPLALSLMAMGGLGPDIPTHIPEPMQKLTVAVTDTEGTRTVVTQFSINATTYLTGKIGAGTISIPLRSIKEVNITKRGGDLLAEAVTLDGRTVSLEVSGSSRILGHVEFGNYTILMGDVRKLEILKR